MRATIKFRGARRLQPHQAASDQCPVPPVQDASTYSALTALILLPSGGLSNEKEAYKMSKTHRLYAMTHSLYLGVLAVTSSSTRYPSGALNRSREFQSRGFTLGKLPTIPTLVTPEGEVIRMVPLSLNTLRRQTVDQVDRQALSSASSVRSSDVIGTDGLLRPAMHYRWNFPEDNLAFVRYHFLHSQRDTPERSEKPKP